MGDSVRAALCWVVMSVPLAWGCALDDFDPRVGPPDAGPGMDAGRARLDAGKDSDAGAGRDAQADRDAGPIGMDAGGDDAGAPDAGAPDAGPPDGGPADGAAVLRPCDAIYGAAPLYMLCDERPTECEFFVRTAGSCNAICSAAGGTCLQQFQEAGNGGAKCTRQDARTCGSSMLDGICVCTRVP